MVQSALIRAETEVSRGAMAGPDDPATTEPDARTEMSKQFTKALVHAAFNYEDTNAILSPPAPGKANRLSLSHESQNAPDEQLSDKKLEKLEKQEDKHLEGLAKRLSLLQTGPIKDAKIPISEIRDGALRVRRVMREVVGNGWEYGLSQKPAKDQDVPKLRDGTLLQVIDWKERTLEENIPEETLPAEDYAAEKLENEGLRYFMARRDAWTCARQAAPPTGTESSDSESKVASETAQVTQVPLIRPIMQENIARAAACHVDFQANIYSGFVLQGKSLAVPIPLSQMIDALVDGWKQDGEWPAPGTEAMAPIDDLKKRKFKKIKDALLEDYENPKD
jgi:hypothetical protein